MAALTESKASLPLTTLCFATNNPHKVGEVREILAGLLPGLTVVGLDETPAAGADVEETGVTFATNSLLKAEGYGRLTGLPTLADDSGLEVAILGGRPGVRSARYAETAQGRIARVVGEVADSAPEPGVGRSARFVCVATLWFPPSWQRDPLSAEGTVDGEIILEQRGTSGFGYDPIFLLPELGRTMAELSPEEKNGLSHRGRALAALAAKIRHLVP